MKNLLFLILLSLPFLVNAQKIKHDDKTEMISVDGLNSFKLERTGCGAFVADDCHFDVFDLEGNKVIRINLRRFNSPVEVKPSNPEGTVRYFEYIFLTSKTKAEIEFLGMKEEKVAKTIVKNQLMLDGKLNEKAVEEFILFHGTPYSERIKF